MGQLKVTDPTAQLLPLSPRRTRVWPPAAPGHLAHRKALSSPPPGSVPGLASFTNKAPALFGAAWGTVYRTARHANEEGTPTSRSKVFPTRQEQDNCDALDSEQFHACGPSLSLRWAAGDVGESAFQSLRGSLQRLTAVAVTPTKGIRPTGQHQSRGGPSTLAGPVPAPCWRPGPDAAAGQVLCAWARLWAAVSPGPQGSWPSWGRGCAELC